LITASEYDDDKSMISHSFSEDSRIHLPQESKLAKKAVEIEVIYEDSDDSG
jgi:hypothetical protein